MTYKEFINKYGDEKVMFYSYYKYTFKFKSVNGLVISVGGGSDTIYRFDVEEGREYCVRELATYSASLDDENLGFWDENM